MTLGRWLQNSVLTGDRVEREKGLTHLPTRGFHDGSSYAHGGDMNVIGDSQ
jgi:hypothetical protein